MIGTAEEIAGAIKTFFTWLIYERDPDKQARRAAARELKYTKLALLCALKIFRYQKEIEDLPLDSISSATKRKNLKVLIEKEKKVFYKLLAID